MAINVSFNGATIFKPGAYSRVNIDLGGGFPLSPTGIVAIFGEASAGRPGDEETDIKNNVYSPEQLPEIREKYRTGPIVDAATFAFAPATDGAIPSGAQALYIYKTNKSVRASRVLAESFGTLRSVEYGEGGNLITYRNVLTAETPASSASSAAFVETSIASGDKFALAIQGAALNTFTFPSAPTSNANLAALLADGANWSGGLPAGMTIAVSGADGASILTISRDADAMSHQYGYSRIHELAAGSPDALAKMNMTAGLVKPSVEPNATIKISQVRDSLEVQESLGGNIVMKIGNSDGTSASVSIDDSKLELTSAGGTYPGTISLLKSSYPTMQAMVDGINLQDGWSASLESTLNAQLSVEQLDHVASLGALSAAGQEPAQIKKDFGEVADFFELNTLVDIISQRKAGLPANRATVALAGGTTGATNTAAISAALEAFTKFRVNSIIPLFSRDASEDVTDGLTDAGSTYTILGIHQAVKTHLSLTATTKKRSERQGYLSFKGSFDASKTQSGLMAFERIQLAIQDIRQLGADGVFRWYQPWALAALLGGARAGAPVGTPLTFKFMNCTGIRHTAQAMTVADEDIVQDFDPDTQTDEAIQAGLTFLEAPQTGGFRVVVDNTTYGKDGNFVKNRGNVQYAADVLAYDFRNQLENIYVGTKNTVTATEVKSVCESILATFLAQGITVSTADAPGGFKGLVVKIDGNTIRVDVVVKIVEGIDFVLADITLQRAQSEA